MRAGRLRHRVDLQEPVTVVDDYGGETDTWSTIGTFWAAVEPIRGKERFASGQRIHERDVRVVMRYVGEITEAMRISFDGLVYDIKAVVLKDSIKREYELLCTQGANDG